MAQRILRHVLPDQDDDLGADSVPVEPNFNAWASNDFVTTDSPFTYSKGGLVLKMLENYLGKKTLRNGLRQYLSDYALGNGTPQRLWNEPSSVSGQSIAPIGNSFVRQTGVPLISLDTQCDPTTDTTTVTLRQQPFPNLNPYPGQPWTVPITLAYGPGFTERKQVALAATQMEVGIDGCSPVVADPSGLDDYVVDYSDAAWDALLTQITPATDPALLANLQREAALLATSKLAPASRVTAIDAIVPAPAAAQARSLAQTSPIEPRAPLRYQGHFVPWGTHPR